MTPKEAIHLLLTEYHLPQFEEVYRDDAKADDTFDGPSWEHPKVKQFREICRVLQAAQEK